MIDFVRLDGLGCEDEEEEGNLVNLVSLIFIFNWIGLDEQFQIGSSRNLE